MIQGGDGPVWEHLNVMYLSRDVLPRLEAVGTFTIQMASIMKFHPMKLLLAPPRKRENE